MTNRSLFNSTSFCTA